MARAMELGLPVPARSGKEAAMARDALSDFPPFSMGFKRRAAPLLLSGLFVTGAHATPVFINEIHYDNSGSDTGEAIEIAGPARTDLTGWSVVLYNGAGGAPYTTTALGGTLGNLGGSGFGVTSIPYPTNGLQNGSPDGIALVDNTNTVRQFLSYEGVFAAVGGPADGLLSTDIGVAESFATPVGYSLQLTGTGSEYEDFTWVAPMPDTFGAFNTSQTFEFSIGTPTELFFSEYVEGSSLNKALEIFNGTGAPIDLDAGNYSIEIYFNGSTTPLTSIDLTGVIPDGDVFVVADDGADAAILAVADLTSPLNFFNGDDAVALVMDGTLVDVIGQIGFDPGSEWGTGDTSTADNTLRRRSTIVAGDTIGSDVFIPAIEWEGFPLNTFDGLGSHSIASGSVPEPGVLALVGTGLAGMAFVRKRRRR